MDDIQIMVLGNNLDLEEKRMVMSDAAMEFATSIKAGYFEVSGVTG